MEKQSIDTQLSTDSANDRTEAMTRIDSNESQEHTRSRGATAWVPAKLPSRKYSFGNYFGQPQVAQTTIVHRKSMNSKVQNDKWTWLEHKSVILGTTKDVTPSNKIAMFDMDGTIIVDRLGRRVTDWEFFNNSVPQKLRELHKEGFRIVIASNQLCISLEVVSATDLKSKVEDFSIKLGVPLTVMLSTKKDKFRKPETGMWQLLNNNLNSNITVDMEASVVIYLTQFFVGDSAGRPARIDGPSDKTDDDKKFAENCGLKFFTPEEYFTINNEGLDTASSSDSTPKSINSPDSDKKTNTVL